jgi:hypothetical protein
MFIFKLLPATTELFSGEKVIKLGGVLSAGNIVVSVLNNMKKKKNKRRIFLVVVLIKILLNYKFV